MDMNIFYKLRMGFNENIQNDFILKFSLRKKQLRKRNATLP